MIMNQSLPDFTGFNSITTNLGRIENRGSLNCLLIHVILKGKFSMGNRIYFFQLIKILLRNYMENMKP